MGRREEFEVAERKLFAEVGVQFEVRWVDIPALGIKSRVLEAGSGEPLLLVHGGGGFAAGWAPLMARLRGRRLLAVDRPGHGLSGFADHRHGLRRIATDFMKGVLDGLGLERTDVAANSMGGLWTFWLALAEPRRVARIAQLGSPALVPGTKPPLPMRLLSVPGLNRLVLHGPGPAPLVRMGEDPNLAPAALAATFAAAQRLPDFDEAWLSLLEACLSLGEPKIRISADELARVEQPTLLIWGDRDPFGGFEVARQTAASLPSARLVELRGEGHLPWIGMPDRCATEVMAFLAEPIAA
jgi:2-hydroxy-6-oxonona-2,4-dienedioate hydrolase